MLLNDSVGSRVSVLPAGGGDLEQQVAAGRVDLADAPQRAATGRRENEGRKRLSRSHAADRDGLLKGGITPAKGVRHDRRRERPRNGDVATENENASLTAARETTMGAIGWIGGLFPPPVVPVPVPVPVPVGEPPVLPAQPTQPPICIGNIRATSSTGHSAPGPAAARAARGRSAGGRSTCWCGFRTLARPARRARGAWGR